jgi:ribosomal protein S18 acetylase RimI-like enzyme
MSDALNIRPATAADEPLIRELASRLGSFPLPAWRTADEIAEADCSAMLHAISQGRAGDEVLIANRGGAIVGVLHMMVASDFYGRPHAHISVLSVSKAAEGTGVGRALIAHAEAWTRRRGLSLLTLNVFSTNTRARRLYEHAGFTPETLKYSKTV